MHKTVILQFNQERIDKINGWLAQTSRVMDEPETIDTLYADFDEGWCADIKVCNGCEDAGPWIDAVMFHEGGEVQVIEPAFDEIEGEYIFTIDGVDRTVVIEVLKE